MGDQVDPKGLVFPVTRPPPENWADFQLVCNRVSRHWGLIRGLIDDQKRARRNRSSSSARLTATLFREVVTRLSLSLEAVDTKDKFNCVPGVGAMTRKVGDKHLVGQVTARNPKHQPPSKIFVAAPAAILVAMSREVKRRASQGEGAGAADTVWLTEGDIRALAAPLCEEDLSHRGDEIVLGEVENFGWGSMAHLLNEFKFGCVKSKELDEKSTIAELERLGKRLVCSSPGCDAFATKSLGELSDRVKMDTFRRSVYCKEHYVEVGGGGTKRKKAAGKGKGKGKGNANSKACDPAVLDDFDLGDDLKSSGVGMEMNNPYASSASCSATGGAGSGSGSGGGGGGTGKIKASWYRRLLGEALLAAEVDRVEATKGVGVSDGLTGPWRKDFAKNATSVYALTYNGQFVADKLETALASSGGGGGGAGTATATATASPILNRASYASCSERDGGGGGGTAASRRTGHSPLAPARAHGAARPGVRLLVDTREKRGATANSQISELTSLLTTRRVPYEVRQWNVGDYGWVVQPDAGKRPAAGEVDHEREFVVPRLLERKRVDDLADSMLDDGRLVRQKEAMLRARDAGVVSEIEIHVEGGTQDRNFNDEIYRRGLTPEKLDAVLRQSERQGFKVVHHRNFVEFGGYLADATKALQRRFDAGTLDYDNFFTWENFVRVSKGQDPLTPTSAAAERAAAAAKAARAEKRGRVGAGAGGRGRPPLPAARFAAAVGSGLRQCTLDGAFGFAGRPNGPAASSRTPSGGGGGGQGGGAGAHAASGASAGVGKRTGAFSAGGSANDVVCVDDDDDDGDDDCSVVDLVGEAEAEAARPAAGLGAGGAGAASASSTLRGGGGSVGGGGRSGGGQGKRKAGTDAGSSPFTIAAAGGYSPAAAAKIRRAASPALSSLSKSAAATASSQGSTPRDEETYSPPPTGGTADAKGGGARSGCVGRTSSRGSKRPRPVDECGGGVGSGRFSADRVDAPGSCNGGGSGGDRVGAKPHSLSFADDDVEEDGEGGGGENPESGNGGNVSGAGGGGSGTSSSRRGNAPVPASSRSADAGVVDLSADSPSPPPPPRSRQRIDAGASPQTQQQGGQRRQRKGPDDGRTGGGGGGGAGIVDVDVVSEGSSSDDEFAIM